MTAAAHPPSKDSDSKSKKAHKALFDGLSKQAGLSRAGKKTADDFIAKYGSGF